MFVTLEGVDGAGKSTQARLLADALGPGTLLLREPGGTPAGERLREILKDATVELTPRAELVDRVIVPALEGGRDVVCDRFVDSTTAYQGGARGIDPGLVRILNEAAVQGCMPDRTVLLRLGTAVAAERADGRCDAPISDRFESEGGGFQDRIAVEFDRLAAAEPERFAVVDAGGSVEDVHARLLTALGLGEGG